MTSHERLEHFHKEYVKDRETFPKRDELFFCLSEVGDVLGWKLPNADRNHGAGNAPEGFRIDWSYVGVDLTVRAFPNRGQLVVDALKYLASVPNWCRLSEVLDKKIKSM